MLKEEEEEKEAALMKALLSLKTLIHSAQQGNLRKQRTGPKRQIPLCAFEGIFNERLISFVNYLFWAIFLC
jgi:hypothetical protein